MQYAPTVASFTKAEHVETNVFEDLDIKPPVSSLRSFPRPLHSPKVSTQEDDFANIVDWEEIVNLPWEDMLDDIKSSINSPINSPISSPISSPINKPINSTINSTINSPRLLSSALPLPVALAQEDDFADLDLSNGFWDMLD